jgi:predicted MFS family arabinose efflux permease
MVPNEGVPWLVARSSVALEAAAIIGPVVGGVLYGAGVWVPLAAVAGLSAFGAAAMLVIRVPEQATGVPSTQGSIHDALDGLRFVRAQSILLGAISLDLFAVLFGGAVTLLPAIAVRLHVGSVGLGWLRAAVGLGAGAMTLLISIRPIRRRIGRVLLGAVAVFGAWTIVLGLTRSYALAFIAIFALSAADAVSVFIRATLVPLATPPEMRGRVLAVENVFIGASNELGGFESGAIGQLLGTTGSIVLGGIGTLVVALAWGVLFAPLRRVDRFPTPPPMPPPAIAAGGRDDAP